MKEAEAQLPDTTCGCLPCLSKFRRVPFCLLRGWWWIPVKGRVAVDGLKWGVAGFWRLKFIGYHVCGFYKKFLSIGGLEVRDRLVALEELMLFFCCFV